MKRNLFFIALLLLVAVSCKKKEELTMIIQGYVTDDNGGNPLEGVTVTLNNGSENYTATTNADGFFYLGSFTVGSYVVVCKKDGYVTDGEEIGDYMVTIAGDFGFEQTYTCEIEMEAKSYSVDLTIFRQTPNGEKLAAANFPYTIKMGYYGDMITGTTDASGLIALSNVPENIRLEINHEFGGNLYKKEGDINIYGIINYGNTREITIYAFETGNIIGLLSSNIIDENGVGVKNFGVNADIVVNFTAPVDTAAYWDLDLEANSSDVPYDITWSSDLKTATLNPDAALPSGADCFLDIDVYDNYNHNYDNGISFETAAK